ncbi:10626_t:CDS:2 [Diversispora eburnea]|uniref:10626_t:CDS:1 n=1 Tax=Diversispora eburnea TaxID=1213867 RepID=A0A9N8W7Q1_9GLOM|nr:10626_t:CDS:2 [Diversispora eburnea]
MLIEFAKLLNINDFKASEGWLTNFKRQAGLKEFVHYGEANSAPLEDLPKYRKKLQNLLKDWPLEDIFNCDETGLFWKMEPSKLLARNAIVEKKKNKQRVTVLLCANITGTAKIRPLVIHYFKTPQPLHKIKKEDLPVNYYWNNKAWMTTEVWNNFLINLNNQMSEKNRSILLLYDQASAHCSEESLKSEDLSNETLHPLPANTTAHLQPMDAEFDNPETPSSIASIISDSTITGDIIPFQQYNTQEIQNLISQLLYEDVINANDYIEIDDSLEIENINITNRIINLVQI